MNFEITDFKIEPYDSNPSVWIAREPRGVRITHLPTGLIEECEVHNTQHKNRLVCIEELHKRINSVS